MNRLIRLLAVFALSAGPCIAASPQDERAEASRALVKEFFASLRQQLVAAMESGGPVNAIEVCQVVAPQIAARFSEEKGWRVARTSLRIRNPANQPDDWERSVLEAFEARKAAGEDPATLEHFEVVESTQAGKAFRYMKAIPTAEKPCLACHGPQIDPTVAAKLDELYPGDQARGFKAGDIRGAFTITQPMP